MSVPWETIIKVYRNELGVTQFKTLSEYSAHFITFLNNNNYLFPTDLQKEYVYGISYHCLSIIKKGIDDSVEAEIHKGLTISESQIDRIVNQRIKRAFDVVNKCARLPTLPTTFEKAFLSKYFQIIEQAIADIFKKHKLSATSHKRLRRVGVGLFVRDMSTIRVEGRRLINYSGLVIAGFGDDDLYPSLVSYELEGVSDDILKYKEDRTGRIDPHNPAAVIPFAQDEMVRSFMEGIAPNYRSALANYLNALFVGLPKEIVKYFKHLSVREKRELTNELKNAGTKMTSTFWDNITKWTTERNVIPVLDTVEVLPVDELAKMAESLVNLTSFKRRVTPVAETVSGPIDVAVISKGDGFIWIKRKHYFESQRETFPAACCDILAE